MGGCDRVEEQWSKKSGRGTVVEEEWHIVSYKEQIRKCRISREERTNCH